MPYRPYPPPLPLAAFRALIEELPADHLARLVEQVVEAVIIPPPRPPRKGNLPYDPRVSVKVLVYGYATGTRSSRQMQRLCRENRAYLFLTRGQTPCYHTLCTARVEEKEPLEAVWVALFAVAERLGLKRVGHVVIDSTKLRADASPEAVLTRAEFAPLLAEWERILAVAQEVDAREDAEGYPGETRLPETADPTQMRDLVRAVRRQLGRSRPGKRAAGPPAPEGEAAGKRRGKQPPRRAAAPGDPPPAPPEAGPASGAPPRPATGPARATGNAAFAAPARLTRQMLQRIALAVKALGIALAEGWDYLCLTDPDARMMAEGRDKKIRECHSFEVAVDHGLLVVGQTCQEGNDNARLEPIVAAAQAHEPAGVKQATADSGFFSGDAVGRLIRAGVDTCIPDSNTAADLHQGKPIGTHTAQKRGKVELVYDAEANLLRCPEGNELRPSQQREHGGQAVTVYRARRSCAGCPRAPECLTQPEAKHRTVKVGAYHAELRQAQERFAAPEHQERYRHRGEAVETVFGFVRGTLGYDRWWLRGSERVACEGRLLKVAYQIRKVQVAWAAGAGR